MERSHIDLLERVSQHFPGLVRKRSWGEEALFYNPDGRLPNGVYFLTIKTRNGPNDTASQLNRGGAYRVNFGLSRPTYQRLFGELPERPAAGATVALELDFTLYDRIMPHPVYAWMGWACVLNPSPETEATMMPMLAETYAAARRKYGQRLRANGKKP